MIAFVRGKFVHKTPAQVIVDVNGVGYELQISINTWSQISNAESGQLLTYLHITENAQTLFGFFEQGEKDLFLQLIGVSGVGATTARMMLSGLKPEEIIRAIVQGNTKQLEGIKGIGKKTAERIVVDLKDKLSRSGVQSVEIGTLQGNTVRQDALNALIALGIAKNTAEAALNKVNQNSPVDNLNIEEIIKTALKNI